MNQQQVNQIIFAIQTLDSKFESFKADVTKRFDNVEQRISSLETAFARATGSAVPGPSNNPGYPAPSIHTSAVRICYPTEPVVYHPASNPYDYAQQCLPALGSGQHVQPSNRGGQQLQSTGSVNRGESSAGSDINAHKLPYAIEKIAHKYQKLRAEGDQHTCHCGAPTFWIDCFRYNHYRWCRIHQRPMLGPHKKCGKDYGGCDEVKWKRCHVWEAIVQQAYTSGTLGRKGVADLDAWLFPKDLYKEKYDREGLYVG